ncbi:MAG: hypothetical protein JXR73_03280 [Candidatus Omnitrophica bacterium]|nr:hypothetical protein [Candidatus Omnitrophota bacterium]
MQSRNFLLYLKALIWSIFVSYTPSTVSAIASCLRERRVLSEYPEFQDTHLGEGLRFIIERLQRKEDCDLLASCLETVKKSAPSIIYRNMVIEVGHYVTAKQPLGDVTEDCAGVVYCLESEMIHVIFLKPDSTLSDQKVHPFQIMPVYTLTVPDPSS